jgi:hypothetical protein
MRFDLAKADVVLAIESDFLTAGPGSVRYARDFAQRRKLGHAEAGHEAMNRLYVAESSPTSTGTVADHRFRLRPSQTGRHRSGARGRRRRRRSCRPDARRRDRQVGRRRSARSRRASRRGPGHRRRDRCRPRRTSWSPRSTTLWERAEPPCVYSAPVEADPVDPLASLATLLDDMKAGKVDLLLVSGVNPVYDAPADLDVAAVFKASPALRIHHGLYDDETAAYCQWHIPAAHYLESWGDARAYDGTVTLVQPLIEPLYRGKTLSEMVGALLGRPTDDAYTLLRETWEGRWAARPSRRPSISAPRRHAARQCAAGDPAGAGRDERRRCRGGAGSRSGRRRARARAAPGYVRSRRALRQQRLAAGAAQADHQADLGERHPARPGDCREARRQGQRHRRDHRARRTQGDRTGLAAAGPDRGRRHRPSGLRAHPRRAGWRTAWASAPTRCRPPPAATAGPR